MSRAAAFRDCVIVQERTDTPDGSGGDTGIWADISPEVAFACVLKWEHLPKALVNDRVATGRACTITIKEEAIAGILKNRFRLEVDSRILKILSIKPTQKLDETEFKCMEQQAGD